eukprot:5393873-Pyramimonas_sp.AAC.1
MSPRVPRRVAARTRPGRRVRELNACDRAGVVVAEAAADGWSRQWNERSPDTDTGRGWQGWRGWRGGDGGRGRGGGFEVATRRSAALEREPPAPPREGVGGGANGAQGGGAEGAQGERGEEGERREGGERGEEGEEGERVPAARANTPSDNANSPSDD